MSTSSREKVSSRASVARRRTRTHEDETDETRAPQWMIDADQRSLNDCLQSLMDAFNDIERVAKPIMDIEDVNLFEYDPGFDTFRRLSSDCITLYNECDAIINDHAGELNEKRLQYLRHLRNLCAHRFGTSMPMRGFLDAVVNVILPMKEPIRSMLFGVVKGNPGTGMEGRVASFNPKKNTGNPRCRDPATSQATQTSCGVQTTRAAKAALRSPTNKTSSKSGYKTAAPKKSAAKNRNAKKVVGNPGRRQKATSQATQSSYGVQTTSPSKEGLRSHTNESSSKSGYKTAAPKKSAAKNRNAKKVVGNPRCRDPATSQATQTSYGVQTNSPAEAVLIGPTNKSASKSGYKTAAPKKSSTAKKKRTASNPASSRTGVKRIRK